MGFYDEIEASPGVYKTYLHGAWCSSASGKVIEIANPSKGGVAYKSQGAGQRNCTIAQYL